MSQPAITTPATPSSQTARWKQWLSLDNRYVPPVFITLILLVGHLTFGILES
jgi:enediyne biosynthesis protein E5